MGTKCALFTDDLPRMLGFREEDFSEIDQSETRIACGGHVC
jgi:hypothetical protein